MSSRVQEGRSGSRAARAVVLIAAAVTVGVLGAGPCATAAVAGCQKCDLVWKGALLGWRYACVNAGDGEFGRTGCSVPDDLVPCDMSGDSCQGSGKGACESPLCGPFHQLGPQAPPGALAAAAPGRRAGRGERRR